jgi:hypothetical protein
MIKQSTASVLVVEGDPAMGALLERDLGRRGFDLTRARSGKEALLAVARRELDVIVSEIHLDDMTGFMRCERFVGSAPCPMDRRRARDRDASNGARRCAGIAGPNGCSSELRQRLRRVRGCAARRRASSASARTARSSSVG